MRSVLLALALAGLLPGSAFPVLALPLCRADGKAPADLPPGCAHGLCPRRSGVQPS